MERYEYIGGPPSAKMVAELAIRHDTLVKQLTDAQATIAALQAQSLKQAEEAAVVFAQLTQRTAELEAAKASQAIELKNNNEYREQMANLQAELEAVRTVLNALRDGYDDLESRQNDLYAELKRVRDQFADLHKMVAALPKVEGEIAVIEVATDEWHVHDAIFTTQEQANNYANALRYRQGMEG